MKQKCVWTAFVILILALMATNAFAQTSQGTEPPKDCLDDEKVQSLKDCPATIVEGGIGYGTLAGVDTSFGAVTGDSFFVRQQPKSNYLFEAGRAPESGVGMTVRGSFFNVPASNSIASAGQVLGFGNADLKPIVDVSTNSPAPTYSATTLNDSSSWAIKRFEVVGRYAFPLCYGVVSVFGGLAYADIENNRVEEQLRSVLVPSRLPSGLIDTSANLKSFDFNTQSSSKYSALGLVFGVEGESVSFGPGFFVRGRFAQSFLLTGGSSMTGTAHGHEGIMLVPTAQGLNGTGPANNNAPADSNIPINESVSAHVSITDLEGAVGFRHGSFSIRAGLMYSRYDNVPSSETWVVKPAQAFQFGSWQRASSVSPTFAGLMVRAGFRF